MKYCRDDPEPRIYQTRLNAVRNELARVLAAPPVNGLLLQLVALLDDDRAAREWLVKIDRLVELYLAVKNDRPTTSTENPGDQS